MYYVTKKKGDFEYASAAKSIRNGNKTRIEYTYIGRVVDKEKNIGYSLFYIESLLPNKDAEIWYDGNVISMLYPNAYMKGEGISDLLEKIGRPDSLMAYHEEYIKFVFDNYSKDKNILVDSMGLPNKSRVFLTQMNIHNNKVNVESRLVIVAQKDTGVQLYFHLMPGSVNDAMSLKPVFEHCSALGIDIDGCLLDAGYSTNINIDEFYDEDHICIHEYVTRPKSTAAYYKEALAETLPTLESKENFVRFEDRFLYIKHVEVYVGQKRDQPAHLYVGLDENRLSDELHKLLKRAKKNKLDIGQVYAGMENQGMFALLSGKEYGVEEILPEYYIRQGIEQLNDISKNYTKLLPIRSQKTETYTGHVVLSMVATAIIRFIQIHLNESEMYLGSRIEALRNQKAIIYNTKIIPDSPLKSANDMYKAFKIQVPVSLPIKDNKLEIKKPKKKEHFFKTPKKRFQRAAKLTT